MTFFVRLAPLRATRSLRFTRSAAAFHTTPIRASLNESNRANHKDGPEVANHNEAQKQDSVKKANEGKGEWKPELASNSEQAIKHDDHDKSIEEMQKEGAQKAEQGK